MGNHVSRKNECTRSFIVHTFSPFTSNITPQNNNNSNKEENSIYYSNIQKQIILLKLKFQQYRTFYNISTLWPACKIILSKYIDRQCVHIMEITNYTCMLIIWKIHENWLIIQFENSLQHQIIIQSFILIKGFRGILWWMHEHWCFTYTYIDFRSKLWLVIYVQYNILTSVFN